MKEKIIGIDHQAPSNPSFEQNLRPIINQLEESIKKDDWSVVLKIKNMRYEISDSVRLSLTLKEETPEKENQPLPDQSLEQPQPKELGKKSDWAIILKIKDVPHEISDSIRRSLILAKNGKEFAPEGVRGNLERDYRRSIDNLEFYRVIKNGIYTGDYEEFKDVKFTVPKMEDIMEGLSPEAIRLYKEMEAREEEPQLQLTPLALNISTLGRKIDARRKDLKINAANTYAWHGIKEKQLIYQPKTFKATNDGKNLVITGGKSKSQLIEENNGWLVSIVATKPELNVDPDKVEKEIPIDGKTKIIPLTTAEKVASYMTEARSQGYEGLNHEAYTIAQMDGLRRGRLLDTTTYAMLPESCLRDQERIAFGDWNEDRLRLYGRLGSLYVYGVRFRRSVKVGINP